MVNWPDYEAMSLFSNKRNQGKLNISIDVAKY